MKHCVICNNYLSGNQEKYCSSQCKNKQYNKSESRKTECANCKKKIWKRRSGNIYCNDCTIRRSYTIEDVIEAVKSSMSIAQVLEKLNIISAGGNYATIKKFFIKHDIDTSHFRGMGWNKNRKVGPKRPIEDYLSNKHSITSHSLRIRLLSEGIFKKECSNCHLSKWLDQDIPLELDHINGDHFDNSIDNIRLLCPNCHALTDTYRGKNKKK